jgi:hypothetical protein
MAAVPATAPITSVAAKQSLLLFEARGAPPAGLLLLLLLLMVLLVNTKWVTGGSAKGLPRLGNPSTTS